VAVFVENWMNGNGWIALAPKSPRCESLPVLRALRPYAALIKVELFFSSCFVLEILSVK